MNYKKILNRALVTVAVLAGCWLFLKYLLPCLLPFLIAALVVVLMEPLVQLMTQRLRFPRGLSSAICTLALLLILGGVIFFAMRRAAFEITALSVDMPGVLSKLSGLISRVMEYLNSLTKYVPEAVRPTVDSMIDKVLETGSAMITSLSAKAISLVTALISSLPSVFLFLITCCLAIYFSSSSWPEIMAFLSRQIPERWKQKLKSARVRLKETFGKWLKAQLMLMACTFIVLAAGLTVIGIEYSFFLAAVIALVDALPVFGVGTIMLPWAAIQLLQGDYKCAVSLIIIYLIAILVRNIMEPKLVGDQIGISPLATLMAIYAGYVLMGPLGMILFPILLILVKQLNDWNYIKLWK